MKSILVIGMGRFGLQFAERMQELGNDVMVVDKDPELIDEIAYEFTDAHIGDCCNEVVLTSLGINNFDICFVTIGEDFQASLEITSMLKEHGAAHVVSKARTSRQAKLLSKIGADEVVYPEREIAEKLAIRYNADNIFDYIQLTSEYSIYEIPCCSKWVNKSVAEINVRYKYNVNIIAVKRDNALQITPGADYVFKEADHLVVIGKASDVFKLGGKAKS
ncbi:MAG: TrkA family potassium uptake protein [Clostridiales bacterium]|jgi:trk system potassium uptake protein TrkA|nr:TrkA family potassium uptake protein [Clostridiales bacterium]